MCPKELSKKDKISKAIHSESKSHPELLSKLKERGLTLKELRGNKELERLVEESPDAQEAVHDFLLGEELIEEADTESSVRTAPAKDKSKKKSKKETPKTKEK